MPQRVYPDALCTVQGTFYLPLDARSSSLLGIAKQVGDVGVALR